MNQHKTRKDSHYQYLDSVEKKEKDQINNETVETFFSMETNYFFKWKIIINNETAQKWKKYVLNY